MAAMKLVCWLAALTNDVLLQWRRKSTVMYWERPPADP